MPLDIAVLRATPKVVEESQRKRFKDPAIVQQVLDLDAKWKQAISQLDGARKASRLVSKSIGAIISTAKKQKRQPSEEENAQVVKLKQDKATHDVLQHTLTAHEKDLKEQRDKLLNTIGNLVHESVPVSNDEEKDNAVIKKVGTLRANDENKLRHHHELLWMIGGYEPERGTAVCGHRGYFLTGPGVLLNMALQNYGVQFLVQRQYKPVYPPFFMDQAMMAKTAQLEDFDEALYHVTGESMDTPKYLIATSEQPISAMHHKEWLQPTDLPIKYAGISTCFRKEAGAHGKDAWGIFRVHQFDKIEQFVYCKPGESWTHHDEMLATSEAFYQSLGLGYRVVSIVSGHLNNAAAKKYDLEGWFPTLQRYRELVSASNCTDYQSIAMETRYGFNQQQTKQKEYAHMLNATLVATTRTICAILENYQTEDGIMVPDVLQPYMAGMKFIPFVRPPPTNKDKPRKHPAQKQQKQKPKPKPQQNVKDQSKNQNTKNAPKNDDQ
mmetsp:Transcript_39121/g.63980  ORF Transcript_39121/g.63980 Transcript_39121/m.63980 type:complete len:495 (+) Transcript_39121:34-1518(+)